MLRTKLKAMLMAQKKDSRIYLYNEGDTCDSITGGWTVIQSAKLNNKSMTIQHNAKSFRLTTNKPVDLTNKRLCIQAIETDTYSNNLYYLAFDLSEDTELTEKNKYIVIEKGQRDVLITKKFNVKQGSYYIRIFAYWGTYRIDKIWLEDKDV